MSSNLPPVRHLPQWRRIGRLGNPCSPRRLPANHLQPLSVAPSADRSPGESSHNDTDPRVVSLQRNIRFLQQQHKETLEKLHAEVECLRRENKELQYKLIMEPPKSSKKGLMRNRAGVRPPSQGGEAWTRVSTEEPQQDTQPSQDYQTLSKLSIGEGIETSASSRANHGPELKGGLITSLKPLRIHSSPFHQPRTPTLQECEVIIRQLYNANSLQSQEIMRVKALLRDIVLNKRITPENYILTKAYLGDGSSKSSEDKKFPKLGVQTFPEKRPAPPKSGVILPALKHSLTSNVAERQRRTRALQRDRLKTTVR